MSMIHQENLSLISGINGPFAVSSLVWELEELEVLKATMTWIREDMALSYKHI